ncbi:MAG: hypothetical protein H6606_01345 [Flavobacteriales bacterium]|nr:hypothetical protein [Flavobacteriales bacterium]
MSEAKINSRELEIVRLDGEIFYKIPDCAGMRPFLMTLVSSGDHWMFIGSNGGLTAGRKNAESALFPYYTDDMILEMAGITGNRTLVRFNEAGKLKIWEPFSTIGDEYFTITRNILKNATGNKVLFEEENHDLGLVFSYMWTFSEHYGFVKSSSIVATGNEAMQVEVLDGVSNILPSGVPSQLQLQRSTLVDAYKRNELDVDSGLAMYALSSMIIDKAEPSEALLATTAWMCGADVKEYLVSMKQVKAFRQGAHVHTETDVMAEKGAFLNLLNLDLKPGERRQWHQVFDVNCSHSDIHNLRKLLKEPDLEARLLADIETSGRALRELVAMSDGMQLGSDVLSTARHYSNVLFNIMRGGLFDEEYIIHRSELLEHVRHANHTVFLRNRAFWDGLEPESELGVLLAKARENGDPDVIRLCYEYLPLYFSRRHGDPSRPWNYFSIETRDAQGNKLRNYEGNWRDIFQNWEALAYSFPEFTESFVVRFLNASTLDGYNPYRISKDGIDWEVEEEDDPWSYIGYWGDHQIIYFLKLFELSTRFHPDRLLHLLNKPFFVYANVPYRIRSYHDLVQDPRNTILFDRDLDHLIRARVEQVGADGKLVWDEDGEPLRANLGEKLMVMLCAKLSNFIPRAGIWLNTQRPEWNDANNALVGNGVSVVTLCYLRRFVKQLFQFLRDSGTETIAFNRPVAQMIVALEEVFARHIGLLAEHMDDRARRVMVDDLGAVGEQYRALAYAGLTGRVDEIRIEKILSLLELVLRFCDDTIQHNKRKDGLYHSYNLLSLQGEKAAVRHLYEMLEGQVAVLSSGLLSAEESLYLLDSLKSSAMYRPDQYSYMLYPNRRLPGMLEKNTIPMEFSETCPLLEQLAEAGDVRLVERDENGIFHFSAGIHNADDIRLTLETLEQEGWTRQVFDHGEKVVELFEQMFDHSAFTGRSGTFFGYEGLGSIYWHMVSKLLLAVQETIHRAERQGINPEIFGRLVEHYYEIRAGIGVNKTPELYGAFPTDAYSHTPMHAGAQQPGMTGQVKEDVINRWAELGIHIEKGCLQFDPRILRKKEFLEAPSQFSYYSLGSEWRTMLVESGSLAFTFCQTPIVYKQSERSYIVLHEPGGEERSIEGNALNEADSRSIFLRNGQIEWVEVHCAPHL